MAKRGTSLSPICWEDEGTTNQRPSQSTPSSRWRPIYTTAAIVTRPALTGARARNNPRVMIVIFFDDLPFGIGHPMIVLMHELRMKYLGS
eukprot:5741169-Pleurochrysis_carterae.AAC.2